MSTESLSFWLSLGGCILAAGLSASRMAFANLSGGKIRKLESIKRDLAERLEPWVARRDEYLILIRVLLLLTVLVTGLALASWLHVVRSTGQPEWRFWLSAVLELTGYFLLSEWVGRHLPTAASGTFLAVALPAVRVLGVLVFPVMIPIFLWHRQAERWREARRAREGKATAEDEIMSLVEKDAEEENGTPELEDDERRMIRGIFDLDETLVHEIMTPRVDVHGVEETTSIADTKATIVDSGHSRIPVFRNTIDQIVGVVYAKDLLDDARIRNAKGLAEIYHPVVFIPETKNIGDLLQEFRQNQNHFAVVLDEYGGTAGIVTIEDILEEIVGEIRDEYDGEETPPVAEELPEGKLIVDARITIDEINELLGVELPDDEDYDTIGGYISSFAGRIPQAGERVKTDRVVAEIVGADPRRILKLKVWEAAEDG